jgi:hypothetical protein
MVGNGVMIKDDFILCYATPALDSSGVKLYFTPLEPVDIAGDDWDDAPAVHNAGVPYDEDVIVLMYKYIGSFDMADANTMSADEINEQVGKWATLIVGETPIDCYAWDTYGDIRKDIATAEELLKQRT